MHTLSIDFLRTDTDAELCEFMARAKNGLPREQPSAQTFAPKQISTVSALFLNCFEIFDSPPFRLTVTKKNENSPWLFTRLLIWTKKEHICLNNKKPTNKKYHVAAAYFGGSHAYPQCSPRTSSACYSF